MFHSDNYRKVLESMFDFHWYGNITDIQNEHDTVDTNMDIASEKIQSKTLIETLNERFSYIVDIAKISLNLINAPFKLYKNLHDNWYGIFIYSIVP